MRRHQVSFSRKRIPPGWGKVVAIAGAIVIAVSVLALSTIGAQGQAIGGPGLEANRVELTVPPTVNLGDSFQVVARVQPQSGPLPITYTVRSMGQTKTGTTGYVFSEWLTALSTGQQPITGTATQGTTVFTDTETTMVIGPQGVVIEAPPTALLDQEVSISTHIVGWAGTTPVTTTWTISDHSPIVHVGGPTDNVSVSWNTTGTKRVAVRACVLGYCFNTATDVDVQPPVPAVLTISWTSDRYYVPQEAWGTNITATLNGPVPTDREVWVVINGDLTFDHPYRITQTVTSWPVFFDITQLPPTCNRSRPYYLTSATGATIADPSTASVFLPNDDGTYGCVLFLPIIVTAPPPTPTPTPTDTPVPPTSTPVPTATATRVPGPSYEVRVNCGGAAYTDHQGKVWAADQAYTLGGWGYVDGYLGSTTSAIGNTEDDPLYKKSRFWISLGGPGYRFTTPNGRYEVTLKFAELDQTRAGQRVFDVQLEGTTVLSGFDIYNIAGRYQAVDRPFEVNVTDGVLNLDFVKVKGYQMVSAIQVRTAP